MNISDHTVREALYALITEKVVTREELLQQIAKRLGRKLRRGFKSSINKCINAEVEAGRLEALNGWTEIRAVAVQPQLPPMSPLEETSRAEIQQAIAAEIAAQKRYARQTPPKVEAFDLITHSTEGYLYSLTLSRSVRLLVDQPITLTVVDRSGPTPKQRQVQGTIIDVQHYQLLVLLGKELATNHVFIQGITFDPSFILAAVQRLLLEEDHLNSSMIQVLVNGDLPPPSASTAPNLPVFNTEQNAAIERALYDQIHLIWGPPGTGKTRTLGQLVAQLLRRHRTCLLLSVSNVAVDQLLTSVAEQVDEADQAELVRVGTPTDASLNPYTLRARALAHDASSKEEYDRLMKNKMAIEQRVRQLLKKRPKEALRRRRAVEVIESRLKALESRMEKHEDDVLQQLSCIATTLATLAVRRDLHDLSFDAVIIDELSMVPMVFTLLAAWKTSRHLILAGDPFQLSPICQSSRPEAQKWIGENAFQHLHIDTPEKHPNVTFLRRQYRMGAAISSLVNTTSYSDQLINAIGQDDAGVHLIQVNPSAKNYDAGSYYSVQMKSYYHPTSALAVARLLKKNQEEGRGAPLVLSPFRAQDKLLRAVVRDIYDEEAASTIHRAQGSEAEDVIIDLTTHHSEKDVAFFKDLEEAQRLINVAMSRAKQRLFILCNLALLQRLGRKHSFFSRLHAHLCKLPAQTAQDLLTNGASVAHQQVEALFRLQETGAALYASLPTDSDEALGRIAQQAAIADQAVCIVRTNQRLHPIPTGLVLRHHEIKIIPPLVIAGDCVAVYTGGSWATARLPETARLLKGVTAGHLLHQDVDAQAQSQRLLCKQCTTGNMELIRRGPALRLRCSNPACPSERRLSEQDADFLAELHDIRCPHDGLRMVARRAKNSQQLFLGCQNYPNCDKTQSLSDLAIPA